MRRIRLLGERPQVSNLYCLKRGDQFSKAVHWTRSAKQKPLPGIAAICFISAYGAGVSMPSAVRFDAKTTAEIEAGVDNLSPLQVVLAISNKAAVDLDLFEAEIAQLRQAGITGTEIIERNANTGIVQI